MVEVRVTARDRAGGLLPSTVVWQDISPDPWQPLLDLVDAEMRLQMHGERTRFRSGGGHKLSIKPRSF